MSLLNERLSSAINLLNKIESHLARVQDLNADLMDENTRLRTAIRKHRDAKGDDRCHQNDGELYSILPEGDTRPACETAVTIENCQKYIHSLQQGQEYISPQRRIEELEAQILGLEIKLATSAPQGAEPVAQPVQIKPVHYSLIGHKWIGTFLAWNYLGPTLVQLDVVKEVQFSDKTPFEQNGRHGWNLAYSCKNLKLETGQLSSFLLTAFLPWDWFLSEEPYRPCIYSDTPQDAISIASQAAISWARKKVGL